MFLQGISYDQLSAETKNMTLHNSGESMRLKVVLPFSWWQGVAIRPPGAKGQSPTLSEYGTLSYRIRVMPDQYQDNLFLKFICIVFQFKKTCLRYFYINLFFKDLSFL